jgi:hypothetical protein
MVTVQGTNDTFLFPEISNFHDKAILEKVNKQLKEKTDNMRCLNDMGAGGSVDVSYWNYNSTATVANTTNDIFSIEIGSSNFCGGAHPNSYDESITFDMRTGEKVPFEKLFVNFNASKKALADIIFPYPATPIPLENADTSGNCEANEIIDIAHNSFDSATYFIKDSKLFVIPSMPHVVGFCAEPKEVSLKTIAQYIDKNGILARLK